MRKGSKKPSTTQNIIALIHKASTLAGSSVFLRNFRGRRRRGCRASLQGSGEHEVVALDPQLLHGRPWPAAGGVDGLPDLFRGHDPAVALVFAAPAPVFPGRSGIPT